MVKKIQAAGEKVVIFSGLRAMVDNIEKELVQNHIKTMKITAAIDCRDRFAAINEFQGNGFIALVAGLNVLNRGYTITKANHVVICDLEYQPESTEQAEDRVHRTGQTKPVNVTYLLSKETIDETMFDVVLQKSEAISHSINGIPKYATTAELLQQLDFRNVQMAIAKKVLDTKTTDVRRETQIETVQAALASASTQSLSPLGWERAVQLSLFG